MKVMNIAIMCAVVVFAAPACDRVGSPFDVLGGKRPGPDEFQVVTRKPLKMPGSLALPEPRLGERSPLEFDAQGQALSALTGRAPTADGGAASAGEQALLSAANAQNSETEIRAQLAQDAENPERLGPYEAPTVLELVGLDGQRAEDVLDADQESERLRQQGVAAAPVNPAAATADTE